MPIQGSGSISLSELATEFGGQAPHSLTEYLKDAGLVDSTRAITGSESYTSLVTGDQVGTTGIYVNGVTVSHNTTTPTVTGQTSSDGSGDDQYDSNSSENSSATFETPASTVTIAQGTYVNITIYFWHEYKSVVISGITYRGYYSYWGNVDASGSNRDMGFTFSQGVDTAATGIQLFYELTSGTASDWTISGLKSQDLSALNRSNYTQAGSGTGWHARPTLDAGKSGGSVTINGYASTAATIKIVGVMQNSDQYDSVSMNGPMTGTDPRHGGTYDAFSFASTLNMNAFKAYNTNSYALSCNGTNIPANTPSGSAITFASNLKGTSVTASITGNQPINPNVPSSGALSLTDFYSSEEQ